MIRPCLDDSPFKTERKIHVAARKGAELLQLTGFS
jgi:hypothetical protein